jgi:hypothetical protein
MRIAIIKDGHAFRIEAPARTKIFNGDRAMSVDSDFVCVSGKWGYPFPRGHGSVHEI